MLKIPRLHLVAIGIVATLVTGCAVVDPSYYDDGTYNTPVYQNHYSDPYYGGSPGYYDNRPHRREYQPPHNDRHDRDDRDQRHRARPDHRDDRDARDRPPPRPQPPALNNPPPRHPPQSQPPPRVVPKAKPQEDAAREHPPRTKSDRYNPKTGQYLPSMDDMP